MSNSETFYGANQPADGSTRGEVEGTLVIDMGEWDTHKLLSTVTAIIAAEVVNTGFDDDCIVNCTVVLATERLQGVYELRRPHLGNHDAKTGVCTPTPPESRGLDLQLDGQAAGLLQRELLRGRRRVLWRYWTVHSPPVRPKQPAQALPTSQGFGCTTK
jgi:hypothetical protein